MTATLAALLNDGPTQLCFLLPLALILVDLVTGLLSAVKRHVYQTRYLADFLSANVLPYLTILVGSLAVPVLVQSVSYPVAALGAKAALSIFLLSQVDSVVRNVSELTGVPEGSLDALVRGLIGIVLPQAATPVIAPPEGSGAVTRPALETVNTGASAVVAWSASGPVNGTGTHHTTTTPTTIAWSGTSAVLGVPSAPAAPAAGETPTLVLPKVTALLPIVSPEDVAAARDASQVRGRE